MFPRRITSYLFETSGQIRSVSFDVAPLGEMIATHRSDLIEYVRQIFHQGWPAADAEVASPAALAEHVDRMVGELEAVLRRIRRRVGWAHRKNSTRS